MRFSKDVLDVVETTKTENQYHVLKIHRDQKIVFAERFLRLQPELAVLNGVVMGKILQNVQMEYLKKNVIYHREQ
jgi:hypothetical protein